MAVPRRARPVGVVLVGVVPALPTALVVVATTVEALGVALGYHWSRSGFLGGVIGNRDAQGSAKIRALILPMSRVITTEAKPPLLCSKAPLSFHSVSPNNFLGGFCVWVFSGGACPPSAGVW